MKALLRRIILVVALVSVGLMGVLPVIAAPVSAQAQFAIPILVANTSFLNVRSGPGVEYSVVATIVGGTELPVLGIASDGVWYLVASHAGNGWVNIDYTIPRGDFRNVPQIDLRSIVVANAAVAVPVTIGLPVASTVSSERFRAAINVESVNLRAVPANEGAVLRILFKNDAVDYAIVNRANDQRGVEWLALDVPGVGVGWIESAKLQVRLSGRYRDVLTVVGDVVGLLEQPMGQSLNVPPLVRGDEVFLLDITPDGQLIKVELPSGAVGWIPFGSILGRENTTTDGLYQPDSGQEGGGTGEVVVPVQPNAPQYASLVAIVNTGNLNIRSGPGAQFTVVATVPGGTQLNVLAMASDDVWYLVSGAFGQGWLNKEHVIFRGSFNNLPTVPWDVAAGQAAVAAPVAVASVPLQVYAAPGTQYTVVGTLASPAEYAIVARTRDGNWLQVLTPFGHGWLPSYQVIIRGELGSIATV